MPITSHQMLLLHLCGLLLAFAARRDLGTVLTAGTRVRLWPGTIREPDVVFMRKEHANRMGEKYWKGADLVMEVVSGGAKDRRRDLKDKRKEYAQAGIPEYWIVDPRDERITVLRLEGKEYAVHGVYTEGMTAVSHLLPGFEVDATTAFAQRLPGAQNRAGNRGNERTTADDDHCHGEWNGPARQQRRRRRLGPRRPLRRPGRPAHRPGFAGRSEARPGVRDRHIAARSTCRAARPPELLAAALRELESLSEQRDKTLAYSGLLHAGKTDDPHARRPARPAPASRPSPSTSI